MNKEIQNKADDLLHEIRRGGYGHNVPREKVLRLLENLVADSERLNWLERFLQLGGSSVFTTPTCQAQEERPDDTKETMWNHPFAIGYRVEVEHRGCYSWEELANGAKGIRPAIDAARRKREAILANTKFRDAGGQSPALRTDDQPHSL